MMKKVILNSPSPPSNSSSNGIDDLYSSSRGNKKRLFKRWGRKSGSKEEVIMAQDCQFQPSAGGNDTSSQCGGSASISSADTELMGNSSSSNHNHHDSHNWEHADKDDDALFSCTSPSDANKIVQMQQSDSPTGVDELFQLPPAIPHEDDDADAGSEATPKAGVGGRKTVSAYFNSTTAVIPLPFGHDSKVPEVTRQTSQQYVPLLPSSSPKVLRQHIPAANEGRKRNSLEDVLRGDTPTNIHDRRPALPRREPTLTSLDQVSAFFAKDGIFPLNLTVEHNDDDDTDTLLTMETLETLDDFNDDIDSKCAVQDESSLGSSRVPLSVSTGPSVTASRFDSQIPPTVSSASSLVVNSRSIASPPSISTSRASVASSKMQYSIHSSSSNCSATTNHTSTSSAASSHMHYSVPSFVSTTPKTIPEDPTATIYIPLQPGMQVPLRRSYEVAHALRTRFYDTPKCPCCHRQLTVVADAAFVYCPICQKISPLFGNIGAVGNYPPEPEYLRFGLGLGMTWETTNQVLTELTQGTSTSLSSLSHHSGTASAR